MKKRLAAGRKERRRARVFLLICVVGLVFATTASGASQRAAGSLNLHALFSVSASRAACPSGAPVGAACYVVHGSATVRGLGRVTDPHMIVTVGAVDGPGTHCAHVSFTPEVMTIAGKGQIDASITTDPGCNGVPTGYVVTGGSGEFAGATGSGTFVPSIVQSGHWVDNGGDDTDPDADDILYDWHTDTWAGSLSAGRYTFDLTPPTISGARSKTVSAPKGARHLRVRFTVTAKDAVDGPVPVSCKPRSGSLFRIGRTGVNCSATDSSANTAHAHFTITVKHRR
jgi:hypothetical protein